MEEILPPPEFNGPALLLAHRAAAFVAIGRSRTEDKDQRLKQKVGFAVS